MYGYLSNIKEDHTNQNIQSESYYTQSSYYNRVKPILFYTIDHECAHYISEIYYL